MFSYFTSLSYELIRTHDLKEVSYQKLEKINLWFMIKDPI